MSGSSTRRSISSSLARTTRSGCGRSPRRPASRRRRWSITSAPRRPCPGRGEGALQGQDGELRYAVPIGDIEAAAQALAADLRGTLETNMRLLAIEERVPAVHDALDAGREFHREWVERTFPAALEGLSGAAPTSPSGAARRRRRHLDLAPAAPRSRPHHETGHARRTRVHRNHPRPRRRTRKRSNMSAILMTVPDGGGTVPPDLSVASALRRRGHRVRVLSDPVLRPEVEAAGAEHVPWTRAPHRLDRSLESEIIPPIGRRGHRWAASRRCGIGLPVGPPRLRRRRRRRATRGCPPTRS